MNRPRPVRRVAPRGVVPERLRRLAEEMKGRPDLVLQLKPEQAFMLAAELQLALRTPQGAAGVSADVARSVVRTIAQNLGPEAQRMIAEGGQ